MKMINKNFRKILKGKFEKPNTIFRDTIKILEANNANFKKTLNKKIKVAESITDLEEYRAIKNIILSGNYVSGANVKLFEQKFSKKFNHNNAVAVNSGTAALHCALIALGIKPKDEVIVPSISFGSTATCVLHNGSKPVFCDVSLENYCLDPEDLLSKITKKQKL